MNSDEIIIEQLDFPENVRLRPGMYIGSTENCDVLLREIVDNSIDEIYASKSKCDTIRVDDTKKMYIIQDNGRGIPITPALNNSEITMAQQSITSLHAGSKFNKKETAVGMNGVGSSAVLALSNEYNLILKLTKEKIKNTTSEVLVLLKKSGLKVDDAYFWIRSEKGYLDRNTVVSKKEIEEYLGVQIADDSMTIVAFEPDDEIMLTRRAILPTSLKYVKYITKYMGNKEVKFYYNGVAYSEFFEPYKYQSNVKITSNKFNPRNENADFLYSFEFMEEFGNTSDSGSVNGLIVNQGYHIVYCRECFKKAFNIVFPDEYHGNEVKGMQFSTIVLCPEPAFSSQTKERLTGIPGIDLTASDPLVDSIVKIIKSNRDAFEIHRNKVLEYNASTKNISRINYIRSKVPIVGLDGDRRAAVMKPMSVKDCTSKNRSECELLLCFTGDTKVLTCNDEKFSFIELKEKLDKGESIYTFSCNSDGELYPAQIIDSFVAKKTKDFIRITLDNGESFECTPDHKHLKLDGTYSRADELKVGDLMMPYYINYDYSKDHINYRIEMIEYITKSEEVDAWCLTVDNELHNFPLAAGIFTKNCEGRSASGSLMQARNPMTQAIMPLRGKPLNATGLDIEEILENVEIKDIIAAIGTGVDSLFSLKKVNYGKIIIVADSDPDGGNIASLLLGLFYGHMKYLVESGMVYICESPLFIQNGNYIYPTDTSKLDRTKPFSRIKGLGELNPDEMKKIACDKSTRRLIRVTSDGIGEAIRLITTTYARKQLLINEGIIKEDAILSSKEVMGV